MDNRRKIRRKLTKTQDKRINLVPKPVKPKSTAGPAFLGFLRRRTERFTCTVCGNPIPPGKPNRYCETCRWKAQEIDPD